MVGFKRKLKEKAVLHSLSGNTKKFPIGEAEEGRLIPGTCLTIQGPFSQVFNALNSYFRFEFEGLNYHIVTLIGGDVSLLTEPQFVIMKTSNPKISSGENSSGFEQSNYDVATEPGPVQEIINKDFLHFFIKACNNLNFNGNQVNKTGFKIRDYFCKLVHK